MELASFADALLNAEVLFLRKGLCLLRGKRNTLLSRSCRANQLTTPRALMQV